MPKIKFVPLPSGCWYSQPSVTPKNWKSDNVSTRRPWQIQYRFYDPSRFEAGKRRGKLVVTKGMNLWIDRTARQEATQRLLDDIKAQLEVDGFNPYTGRSVPPAPAVPDRVSIPVDRDTPLPIALDEAFKLITCTPSLSGIGSTKKYVKQAIVRLKLQDLAISKVTRRHIYAILGQCAKDVNNHNPAVDKENRRKATEWTPSMHNHYRTDLMTLFGPLDQLEVIDFNPVEKIEVKPVPEKIRPVLTAEERRDIDKKLRAEDPAFHRFVNIFFASGCRPIELFRVKAKDVDLKNQEFKVLVKKGRRPKERMAVITDAALPYWRELITGAGREDFIFSRGFLPGPQQADRNQASDLWLKYVKDELRIDKDLYSLKHLALTETREILEQAEGKKKATALTSQKAGHTSDRMLNTVYDVRREQRKNDELKGLNNGFLPIMEPGTVPAGSAAQTSCSSAPGQL